MWKTFRRVYGKRVKRIKGHGLLKTREITAQILKESPHDYDVVGGHVRYGVGENCTDRPYQYFTVLRDPTHALLSRYYKLLQPEVQERKAKRDPGDYEDNLRKIKKIVSSPEELLQNSNHLLLRFILGIDEDNETQVTRDHLELAKIRLKHEYVCFGLVERYQESMELISRSLRWEAIPMAEQCNTGGNRPDVHDPKLIELGRQVNALDYELYSYAEQLFSERLRQIRS
ncbi:hypothetical protein [Desulfonatronospira thiodismutans]